MSDAPDKTDSQILADVRHALIEEWRLAQAMNYPSKLLLESLMENSADMIFCEICHGSGGGNNEPCSNCGGEGYL